MKTSICLLLILIGSNSFAQTAFSYQKDFPKILEETREVEGDLAFHKLYERFQKQDKSLTDYEVLALLIGFTAQPEYLPYDNLLQQREIFELNVAGKFEEARQMGQTFVKSHPFNIRGHLELAFSFQNLNEFDSSEYHAYQAQRIQNAMEFSGDGKTENTAMFALGSADGKDFVLTRIRAEILTKGSSTDKNSHVLAVFLAKQGDEKQYYYFNIHHASKTIFAGKATEKKMKKRK